MQPGKFVGNLHLMNTRHDHPAMVSSSPAMKAVYRLVAAVAPSPSTVLLLGETGTGKELIARAIHEQSPRKGKPMVKVNCAALPAELIESELFGHERGSFTGAADRRIGKFEQADGGTLFLDEIGEMPIGLQVRLLRALQEREIERIGGKGHIKVDVRVIAATNRDLETEMTEGRFRRDLFYRLNIFPITLPPLRSRVEDIPALAASFVERYARQAGRAVYGISVSLLEDMKQYPWPGNVRELENLIERSVLLTGSEVIRELPLTGGLGAASMDSEAASGFEGEETPEFKTIDDMEREHIAATLEHCRWRVGGSKGAANLLGVPPSTLFSKMKKLNIVRKYAAG
jgi:formate hydrogenlyase transcriptional activator